MTCLRSIYNSVRIIAAWTACAARTTGSLLLLQTRKPRRPNGARQPVQGADCTNTVVLYNPNGESVYISMASGMNLKVGLTLAACLLIAGCSTPVMKPSPGHV